MGEFDVSPGGMWLPWTPGYTGFSAPPTNPTVAQYTTVGGICVVLYTDSTTGTSNSTSYTMTGLPFASLVTQSFLVTVDDNSATQNSPGLASLVAGSTVITFQKTFTGGTFTASGGKAALNMMLVYPF